MPDVMAVKEFHRVTPWELTLVPVTRHQLASEPSWDDPGHPADPNGVAKTVEASDREAAITGDALGRLGRKSASEVQPEPFEDATERSGLSCRSIERGAEHHGR